jgi:hypothetical protein
VWTGWSAAQRDFFVLGANGELVYRANLTPGELLPFVADHRR